MGNPIFYAAHLAVEFDATGPPGNYWNLPIRGVQVHTEDESKSQNGNSSPDPRDVVTDLAQLRLMR